MEIRLMFVLLSVVFVTLWTSVYAQAGTHYSTCDDVAIIGAGISGSYTAWRLRERGWKISLYEYSNRIGGRFHTVKLPGIPDINIELGAMRFKPEEQPLFNQTVHELGMTVVDFPQGYGPSDDTLYYLRGKHMLHADVPTHAPYNIPDNYRYDFDTLKWHVFVNYTIDDPNVSDPLSSYNRQRIRSIDGVKLGSQSRQTYDSKFLDTETAAYIAEASSFSSEYGPMTAASSVPTTKPHPCKIPVETVSEGFQAIPEKMVRQFLAASNRHSYNHNHHLKSIKKGADGVSFLSFQPTVTKQGYTSDDKNAPRVTTCAKKVVLAVTQQALQCLDWSVLKRPDIRDMLDNSVTTIHTAKMYFGYDTTWWKYLPLAAPYAISTTPLRQTYDFGKSYYSSRGVLNPSYTDVDAAFWRSVQDVDAPVQTSVDGDMSISMSQTSVFLARKFYAEVFNVTVNQVPQPHSAVMRIGDEYPFGTSWYEWMPNYFWNVVEERMMKPSSTDEVYILGNIFSSDNLSSWAEGALILADKFLAMLNSRDAYRFPM